MNSDLPLTYHTLKNEIGIEKIIERIQTKVPSDLSEFKQFKLKSVEKDKIGRDTVDFNYSFEEENDEELEELNEKLTSLTQSILDDLAIEVFNLKTEKEIRNVIIMVKSVSEVKKRRKEVSISLIL